MRIEVTQEDIDAGKRADACDCPVALAICRASGFSVSVRYSTVYRLQSEIHAWDSRAYLGELPNAARYFVVDFDEGRAVAPFAFDLDIPSDPTGGTR
jgi:hypothetical protein